MRWTPTAEEAIAKTPFFIRRRVRKKVEQEAERQNAPEVTIEHVRSCQQNFLKNMEDEIKGFQIESCFGSNGCPNKIPPRDDLKADLEDKLQSRELKKFLKSKVNGPLKFHHEFRISLSDCPNACSRPQVADLGVIAAVKPMITDVECSRCAACADVCIEHAVTMNDQMWVPTIDTGKCLFCGHCIRVCPTGTLVRGRESYRVMVGGKLGRHPRLASEIPGLFSESEASQLIDRILDFYMTNNLRGERFGEIVERYGLQKFLDSVL